MRDERVDPRAQDEQRFPGLDRQAIANDGKGWQVPESAKRKVIEKNAEVLFERNVIWDDQGNEIVLPPDRAAIEKTSRVLLAADQTQYERDHPAEAGKAKGGGVQVGVGVKVVNWDALYARPNVVDPLEAALKTLPQSCPQAPEQNANGAVPPTEPSE